MSSASSVAGFVLAGGRSHRMGRDKALIELAGRPLIAHALDTLRQSGIAARIAGARSDLAAFAPVIPDAQSNLGPLSGICSAMASTDASLRVFLSVDLPFLPASLIHSLITHAQLSGAAVTLASVNGFPQTFPAILRREILPALHAELAAGRAGCYAAFKTAAASLSQPVSVLPAEFLAQSGHVSHPDGLPVSRWFQNINTARDLERAAIA